MEVSALQVVVGGTHSVFPMGDPSRVGEARRFAARLAEEAGLDDTAAGRLALVVTELGNNLVRHATNGRLLIARHGSLVEVVSIDEGPGMPDAGRAMSDGFSTGGTPGTGLGAIRRLSDQFDLHSAPGEGTVAVSRVFAEGAADAGDMAPVAGIRVAAPGETACGDAWAAALDGARASLLLADGLGHGPAAAEASEAATEVFAQDPMAAPRTLIERAHVRLRPTRGAAVTCLAADTQQDAIRACGAGNVMARIVSGVSDRTLLTQHGTVGVQIRRPEETVSPWPDHALIALYTDGIESRWPAERLLPVLARDPALAAAILIRDHCRGRDDATVVVLRRKD